ncbi:MAG: glycosyltransferase family 4 protein [bacterium]|nr:glycosyltransferase family 4 protein [bacterium]
MTPYTILYCHHYEQISGGETSLLELFRTLDREQFRPLLAGPAEGPFPEAARALGVEVIPHAYRPLRRIGALLGSGGRLAKIAQDNNASLLHANAPVTNIPAAIAGRIARRPVIWHARVLAGPGEIDLDRHLSFLPNLIISNSDAIRERFRFRGKLRQNAITIINGVDTGRFHPGISGEAARQKLSLPAEATVFGVVGRISPIKGQATFIEAAIALLEKYPKAQFLLIGAGLFSGESAHERALRNKVHERNLHDRIHFCGYQSDVRPFMAALDVCVVPSDQEGCGRAIFEAMAMEKPVIGTGTGGTPEIITDEETGILIPARDPAALATAMERLLEDDALRKKMGGAGRRKVEAQFTLEAHALKTETAYLKLLEGVRSNG